MTTAVQRVVWSEAFARDAGGAAPLETVRVDLDGRSVAVLPLWIAVHQPQDGGPARSALARLRIRSSVQWSAVFHAVYGCKCRILVARCEGCTNVRP